MVVSWFGSKNAGSSLRRTEVRGQIAEIPPPGEAKSAKNGSPSLDERTGGGPAFQTPKPKT